MSKSAQLAQGTTFFIESATPDTWIEVKEIKAINPTTGSASELDCTTIDSTAKEFRTGLMDNGSLGLDIFILEDDVGQTACLEAYKTSAVAKFKMVSPAKTRIFSGSVKSWPTMPTTGVDALQEGSAEIRVSGDVAVTSNP